MESQQPFLRYKQASDAYLRSNQLPLALSMVEECTREFPDSTMCWFGIGVVSMHRSGEEDSQTHLVKAKYAQRKAWDIALANNQFPLTKDCSQWRPWVDHQPPKDNTPQPEHLTATHYYTPPHNSPSTGSYGQNHPRLWDHKKGEEVRGVTDTLIQSLSKGNVKRIRSKFNDRPIVIHKIESAIVQFESRLVTIQPSARGGSQPTSPACDVFLCNYIEATYPYRPDPSTVNRPVLRLERAALLHWLDNNYYHWTVEVMAKIRILHDYLSTRNISVDTLKLLVHSSDGFAGQAMKWMGVPESAIVPYRAARHQYHVDELYVVTWQDNKDETETPFLPPPRALESLRAYMEPKLNGTFGVSNGSSDSTIGGRIQPTRLRNKVIYVSRGGGGAKRAVKNQDALIQALGVETKNAGKSLVVHTGGGQTFEEQAQLFNDAVVIIGPHGAGIELHAHYIFSFYENFDIVN